MAIFYQMSYLKGMYILLAEQVLVETSTKAKNASKSGGPTFHLGQSPWIASWTHYIPKSFQTDFLIGGEDADSKKKGNANGVGGKASSRVKTNGHVPAKQRKHRPSNGLFSAGRYDGTRWTQMPHVASGDA